RYGLQSNGGLVFIELSSAVKLAELLGGGDDSIKQLKPTLLAFKSILAGGRYRGNVAEGTLVVDIDMDKVNFELLGKFLGSSRSALSDPTRNPQRRQPQQPAKPPTRTRKPGQIGL
ncbi:MAG: hypothetical protein ACAI44_06115, partial [Candidatus Sericytochromatia bacterium]